MPGTKIVGGYTDLREMKSWECGKPKGDEVLGMWQVLVRRWKYLTARQSERFEEKADPKIQLEQALKEARAQHRRLTEHATTMIANQKQTEMQLHRTLAELQRVNDNARHAVQMAEQANVEGDLDKVSSLTQTAEKFAGRIITLEQEVENLKSLHSQISSASEQARATVAQSALNLQAKQQERQKLLSQLSQAKLQEQMNKAMDTMQESVDEDEVPGFNEVRNKIEARYAKAKGVAELSTGDDSEISMLALEAEVRSSNAKNRLNLIKEQLGIPVAEAVAAIDSSSTTTTPNPENNETTPNPDDNKTTPNPENNENDKTEEDGDQTTPN